MHRYPLDPDAPVPAVRAARSARIRPRPRSPRTACSCGRPSCASSRPASTPRCRSALRTMRKIEAIVREEMDATGAQEIRMPIVLPAEPWKQTGRWERLRRRAVQAPGSSRPRDDARAHQEEVVAPLVAAEFPSYRDLPVNLYQVEWKYRDELRPRFGLLRGREFLMKDAYSFDRDEDGTAGVLRDHVRGLRAGLRPVRLDYVDRGGRPRHDRRRREPRVHGARRGGRGPVRRGARNGDYLADTEAATPRAPEPPAGPSGAHGGGRHARRRHDRAGGRAARVARRADAEEHPVRHRRPDGRRPRARRPRGERDEARPRCYFPAPVRRFEDEDFAASGFAKGYVGPAGARPRT